MSLADLGKNDISEETQALKDRLASQDTENAGLRTRLMRREAELEELQATLNETVYKLSKEAERALHLEEEVLARSSELRTERISLQNAELALQSTQEKLKTEERAKKELESTLDTVSLHSQATSAEHQSIQREKRALESRVRELERIVQTHEAKSASNMPRKNGRPRSSSVSSFRLPVVEQELNDIKAQLHSKDSSLRTLEKKLAQAQNDLVKVENARISVDKSSQKRISELVSTLERKEEELELLREMDNSGEREEELLKRIDEDAAKIVVLEKLVAEGQAARTKIQRLQTQLKAECEKVHHSEGTQNRLLHEKQELARQYDASQWEVAQGHKILMARESQIKELEERQALLQVELDAHGRHTEPLSLDTELSSARSQRPNGFSGFPEESALADHIQTLLQAIDRLRGERDGLKRALEFSEVEYRITTESFQTRIAALTSQLSERAHDAASDNPSARAQQRMKQLASCATAFAVVISNLQSYLDLSEDRLSTTLADFASSNTQLHDKLAIVDSQKDLLTMNALEHDLLLQKYDALTNELSKSDDECGRVRLQLADVEEKFASMQGRAEASEAAREEANQKLLSAEQRFATLRRNYLDIESERNSLALQVTNLQDDLACVRDDLADTQNRYDTLHAQQLSAMSASEVMQALKDRIRELEARVVHCNDQIGDYQHDIRRLEANVKLHEERIIEMTSEIELLASQKEAMVEDCAEAREARDEAIERLEAAEEEAERSQQRLEQAKNAHEAELSTMTSMVTSLTSENQQTAARLADLEAENAGFIQELDSLSRDHHLLSERLNVVASCSSPLEPKHPEQGMDMQQAVISLAIVYRLYKDCTRRLRGSSQRVAILESQLVTLTQELEGKDILIDSAKKERRDLLQRLSSVTAATQESQDNPTRQDDIDLLRHSLQEKELELVAVRHLVEETRSRYAEVEAELLGRITTMTEELQAQAGQAEDVAGLRAEIQSARAQLQDSLENFADLEKLHDDVVQDLINAKEVFECRLADTDEQIQTLEVHHRRSMASLEAKHRHEVDVLTGNLEDREQELDELRQQLQDISDIHTRAEEKLHEELESYQVRHALANDVENDLRRTIVDMRQRFEQVEAEALTLQEERQLLQTQITGFQAEIQRSVSLTRYLESQVRESEEACMVLKESLQRSELILVESEKAGKAAEFNLTLQATQHEKVVAAFRREIASLQSGPELRSALADLEERNQEMDDLLRAKCQEIEEYDDRILETLKANKKLTSKVESLTRKVNALQGKLSFIKNQPREPVTEPIVPKTAVPTSSPPALGPTTIRAPGYPSSSQLQESSVPPLTLRSKTPEPRTPSTPAPPPSRTPARTSEPSGCEMSTGKKRPAPDDDERDNVPAEGHYSTDACLRNGPTPRLRRAHGHPAGFTPVRGASLRKHVVPSSPRRANPGVMPSDIITDVTNSPRGSSRQVDVQLKKRSWLGKIRGGTGSQPGGSRPDAVGGQ